MHTYRGLPLGTVDASVVVAAERLGVTTVATIDRRDLSVVRPIHCDRLTILPDALPGSGAQRPGVGLR